MKAVEEGILIHRAPYSETSLLITILCKTQGLMTFLFQGGKKKHGNILFPMAQVEFAYYKRTDSSLAKITEVHLTSVAKSIPFDPIKSGIAFFMAELIQQVVKSGHAENQLFYMLQREVEWLDASDELTNYPLWLLAVVCVECGIAPAVEAEHPTVLDLIGGKLTTVRPNHVQYIEGDFIHWFETMLQEDRVRFLSHSISKQDRLQCFDAWLLYYRSHLQGIRPFKSVDVIREIF